MVETSEEEEGRAKASSVLDGERRIWQPWL